MNKNRLSSFFLRYGMMDIASINRIRKNHVYYIKTNDDKAFIVKRHRNKERIEKQWRFFEQQSSSIIVPFYSFPNQKQYLYDNGYYWTLSPYISGRKLSYSVPEDRLDSLMAIQTFHRQTTGSKGHSPVRKEMFYTRWHKRLQLFQGTQHLFWEHGYASLFDDIIRTTKRQLQFLPLNILDELERESLKSGTWIHGDVASHNFIRHKRNIRMIDFDLLLCAPALYDYIQLGQRFLSYLNWDLQRLLAYNMVQEDHLLPWLSAIMVPSDVLRDWLHFLSNDNDTPVSDYLGKMAFNWEKRQSFLKSAKLMLK